MFDTAHIGHGWKVSPATPTIKTSLKFPEAKSGSAFGKAIAIVDCSAQVASAWYFEYCSYQRKRHALEDGDLSRLELMTEGTGRLWNEKHLATVKKLPFPFKKREFLIRQELKVEDGGQVFVGGVPFERDVDYGSSMGNPVRGKSHILFSARDIESMTEGVSNQAEITMIQNVVTGGPFRSLL